MSPTHGRASTSRMRTAISRWQYQSVADSCFTLIGVQQYGKAVGFMKREKPRLKKYLTAEVSAKQSIKRQLHTTHVGAVGCARPIITHSRLVVSSTPL